MAQQLREVGIEMETLSIDSNVFFASFAESGPSFTGELDLMQWSDAPAYPDPDHYYWLCDQIPTDEFPDGGNFQRICDEELDGLFQQQISQTSIEDREQTFYQITKLMHDNVYWLGMWEDPDVWAVGSRLQNVSFAGPTPLYSIADWDISD